jgi:hypothetical protein
MLNQRELRLRRLAYELWERAGQRGVFSDYLAYVESELAEEDEGEPGKSSPRDLPFF